MQTSDAVTTNTTRASRYHYMDAARSILMALGIFYHGAAFFSPSLELMRVQFTDTSPFLDLVRAFIHHFRMEAFFLVSGFFFGLGIGRYRASEFLGRRLLRLGIPMLFCGLVINAISYYLYETEFQQNSGSPMDFSYYLSGQWLFHLWFLANLILYLVVFSATVTLTPAIWLHRINQWVKLDRMWLWIPLFVLSLSALLRIGLLFPAWPFGKAWFGLFDMPAFFSYMPFFILGYLLWQQREQFDAIVRRAPWFAIPVALFWAAYPFLGEEILKTPAYELTSFTLKLFEAFLALYLFKQLFQHERSTITKLADASYTIYLTHILVLTVCAKLFLYLGLDNAWVYIPLTLFTLVSCYAIHAGLIVGRPLAELLMNGKPMRRHTESQSPTAPSA